MFRNQPALVRISTSVGLTTRQRFRQTISRPPPQCAVGLKPTRAHVVPSSDARGINKRYKIRFPGGKNGSEC